MGRGILLWLLGVPIPIIILIAHLSLTPLRSRENRSRSRPQDRRLRGAVGVHIAADRRFFRKYMATVGGRVRDDLPMAG